MLSGLVRMARAYISSICVFKPPFLNIAIAAMRVCGALSSNVDIAYRQSRETGHPASRSAMKSRTSHLSLVARLMKGTTELIGAVAFLHASSQSKWDVSL